MELDKALASHIESNLLVSPQFLVDVLVKPLGKDRQKVTILVDSDTGITIEECASISRKVHIWVEENQAMDGIYTLEVSSPGVDYPLTGIRSFTKNIGRHLAVVLPDLSKEEGLLQQVDSKGITILPEPKSKKETPRDPLTIPFENIKKATVKIVF